MLNYPGRPISIHDVGGLLGDAYPKAFTPCNITSGFPVAGTYPFNPDIFGEDEFLPSAVTDRPDPNIAIEKAKISFVKPDKEDIAEVDNKDFVRILPTPNITGGTKYSLRE
ncbi:hypothetical protein EB796_006306 [Bugula neritina]|uniref:Uncharacterized protein n=1 Tax=Bugula neritina TaxID=10212 RepID=A0A7J7KBS4_BUGNE|nr:hypothetical protein EB796_006306 [Bugula neritina]